MNRSLPQRSNCNLIAVLCWLNLVAVASGQIASTEPLDDSNTAPKSKTVNKQTPVATSGPSDADETVALSPFIVSTENETGYLATSTLAGTRLKTDLANTPVPVSIMTTEFLKDIGAIDANEAMEYSLNAGNNRSDVTGNTQAFTQVSYSIRGFSGATTARNYFNSPFLSDAYNIDYIEVARGPNSVLFGVASPAGLVSSATKVARLNSNRAELQFRVGRYDDSRQTLDISRAFGKTFAARLNILYQDSGGFYDFQKTERKAATLTTTWRPLKYTTVRTEFERARYYNSSARPFPISDGVSAWVAAGSPVQINPADRPTNTTALYALGAGMNYVYFPDGPTQQSAFTFSGNFLRSSFTPTVRGGVGTDYPGDRFNLILPRNANLLGPGAGATSDNQVIGVFIEQQVGRNFTMEAAWYHQKQKFLSAQTQQFNDNMVVVEASKLAPVYNPTTGAFTGYADNPLFGKYLVRGSYSESESNRTLDDVRVTASYDLDLTRRADWTKFLGHHRLATLLQRRWSDSESIGRAEVNRSPTRVTVDLTSSANYISRFNVLDFSSSNLDKHGLLDPHSYPIDSILLGTPGARVVSGLANINWSGSKSIVDSEVLATQSSFLGERLWVTAGIRRDGVANRTPTPQRDTTTKEFTGAPYVLPWSPKLFDTTKSIGGTLRITSWLSAFANRSDNFQVQAGSMLFGEVGIPGVKFAGNTKGNGEDLGVRFNLFKGKLSLSVDRYKTSQIGQTYTLQGIYASLPFYSIWPALGQSHQLDGVDLQDITSKGVEFELTYNATKNLRLTLNYSRIQEFGQVRNLNNVRAYLDANKALWLAPENASKPIPPSMYGSTVGEAWSYLQRSLATDMENNGRMPFGLRPDNANAFARYKISDGKLKGLAVGAGVNWRGKMVLGYANNDASRQLRGYEQFFLNGLLSYERTFWKTPVSFQLNVDNILGFDDVYPRRYYWYGDTQGSTILYMYPAQVRKWSLSTSARF